jgi:hypothetical protein
LAVIAVGAVMCKENWIYFFMLLGGGVIATLLGTLIH